MTRKFADVPAVAFHITAPENWPAIRRTGLHSAEALIRQARLPSIEAARFIGHRPKAMRLPSGVLIRDQRPMPPRALERCLDPGLYPDDWYRLINSKVFFWLDTDRVNRHLAARGGEQTVITVDLQRMLERHGSRASVAPFNVGNARRRAAKRGRRTFVPLACWLATRWETEAAFGRPARPRSARPVELTFAGSVSRT